MLPSAVVLVLLLGSTSTFITSRTNAAPISIANGAVKASDGCNNDQTCGPTFCARVSNPCTSKQIHISFFSYPHAPRKIQNHITNYSMLYFDWKLSTIRWFLPCGTKPWQSRRELHSMQAVRSAHKQPQLHSRSTPKNPFHGTRGQSSVLQRPISRRAL